MLVSVALDPVTNDIALRAGASYLVYGVDAVVQAIRSAFAFFKGDWFLDRREGTPWYQSVLGVKGISFASLNLIWTQVVLSVPGVTSVKTLSTNWLDRAARTAVVVFEIESSEGPISSADFAPFIVSVPDAVQL